jgi:hypothetical protein
MSCGAEYVADDHVVFAGGQPGQDGGPFGGDELGFQFQPGGDRFRDVDIVAGQLAGLAVPEIEGRIGAFHGDAQGAAGAGRVEQVGGGGRQSAAEDQHQNAKLKRAAGRTGGNLTHAVALFL